MHACVCVCVCSLVCVKCVDAFNYLSFDLQVNLLRTLLMDSGYCLYSGC